MIICEILSVEQESCVLGYIFYTCRAVNEYGQSCRVVIVTDRSGEVLFEPKYISA